MKVHYLIVACSLFAIFFLVSEFAHFFAGQLALESDGRNIRLYFQAGQTLWDVFKQKAMLFILLVLPVYVLGELVLFLVSGMGMVSLLYALLLTVPALLLFMLASYLSSLIYPRFDFLSLEQIQEFPDKAVINQSVNMMIPSVLIPLSLLPCAFYLADWISWNGIIAVQFVIVPLLYILGSVLVLQVIRGKLKGQYTLNHVGLDR